MNKLKFWFYNIIATLYLSIFIVQSGFAEEKSFQIEVQCSESLEKSLQAPWKRYDGIPGVQYILTTKGLLKDGGSDVTPVYKSGFQNVTKDKLFVSVEARCVPRNFGVDVSSTDSIIICDEGEGIEIKMYKPNAGDKNKYRYAGVLTMIKEDDNETQLNTDVVSFGVGNINLSPMPAFIDSSFCGIKIY